MLSQASSDISNTAPWRDRVASALAFALVSFVIVFTNKIVLCNTGGSSQCYAFPSVKFLAFVQCCATCFVMLIQKFLLPRISALWSSSSSSSTVAPKSVSQIPAPSWAVLKQIMPLPIFFFFNMITGLSATKKLNIPMFVLLRRFSIPMTMILEFYLLRTTSTRIIMASVVAMLVGALVAASDDITVNNSSVAYILLNDLFTALQGVVLKFKMNEATAAEKRAAATEKREDDEQQQQHHHQEQQHLTSDGIIFYNSLIASGPAFLWWLASPEEVSGVLHFKDWLRPGFLFWFLSSMFLGFALNYCYFLCTKLNSALTSTVVGVAKNTVSTFVGMIIIGDYKFSPANFTGVCISVFAALLYSYGEIVKAKVQKFGGGGEPPQQHHQQQSQAEQQQSLASSTAVVVITTTDAAEVNSSSSSKSCSK